MFTVQGLYTHVTCPGVSLEWKRKQTSMGERGRTRRTWANEVGLDAGMFLSHPAVLVGAVRINRYLEFVFGAIAGAK